MAAGVASGAGAGRVGPMQAYLLDKADAAPQLGAAPRPVCGPQEILIRVTAASVNPVDRLVAAGYFQSFMPYHFPVVLGRDVAGVVTEVGQQVDRFVAGDRVFGFIKRSYAGDGSFAEYVAVPADRFVSAIPPEVTDQQAGVLGVSGVTALTCLSTAAVAAGRTVLVCGAAGGVGTFAVQLARAAGARVIATARSGEQSRLLGELGAVEVLDWASSDLTGDIRQVAPDGVRAVLDLARPRVGDARAGEAERHRSFAEFVQAVAAPGCQVVSTTNGVGPDGIEGFAATNVHSNPEPLLLDQVAAAVAEGTVRPVIGEVFALADIDGAMARLDQSVTGKIALSMPSAD